MAGEQETFVEPSDAEMFNSAFADEPAEPQGQQEQPASQPRDEHGRFAQKSDDEPAEPGTDKAEGDDRDDGKVPSWRLREIREERDRLAKERETERRELEELRAFRANQQRQHEQQRQQQYRPDPIADPDGYDAWVRQSLSEGLQTVEEQMRDWRVNMTFADAHEQHGEKFEAAMKALEQSRDPRAVAEIQSAINPAKALMKWHSRQRAIIEAGDDFDGFLDKKLEERMKDPEVRKRILAEEAEARGGNGVRSIVSIPSVNRATGGGAAARPGRMPVTDQDFFNDATAGLGRR